MITAWERVSRAKYKGFVTAAQRTRRAASGQRTQDLPEHKIGMIGDFLAPEAQHAIPEAFQHQRALARVLAHEGAMFVHELDDEGFFGADIVDHERTDGCPAQEAMWPD